MEFLKSCSRLLLAGIVVFGFAGAAGAAEQPQEWELVTPIGVIEQAQIDPAPRINTLEGKTIALRWNGKNNGDIFLDRLAELLTQKFPSAKVLKTYADDPSLNSITGNVGESRRVADVLKGLKPDIIIAAQCD